MSQIDLDLLAERLAMRRSDIASIIGCSPSTWSRWRNDATKIEFSNRQIIELLDFVAKKPPKTRGDIVERTTKALATRGRLGALHVLLKELFREDKGF